jgi:hypothetical protein
LARLTRFLYSAFRDSGGTAGAVHQGIGPSGEREPVSAPYSVSDIARRFCARGDWCVTNLELQKMLYIVQMLYMGETNGHRLIQTQFEAWDYTSDLTSRSRDCYICCRYSCRA